MDHMVRVRYVGNGSISGTYNGKTYAFSWKDREKDIPAVVYDYMKLSRHVEAENLKLVMEDTTELKKEIDALKKENAELKAELLKKVPKEGKAGGRRKKTL